VVSAHTNTDQIFIDFAFEVLVLADVLLVLLVIIFAAAAAAASPVVVP